MVMMNQRLGVTRRLLVLNLDLLGVGLSRSEQGPLLLLSSCHVPSENSISEAVNLIFLLIRQTAGRLKGKLT
jgi:hypothetical protein